jgi:hypothetical protein
VRVSGGMRKDVVVDVSAADRARLEYSYKSILLGCSPDLSARLPSRNVRFDWACLRVSSGSPGLVDCARNPARYSDANECP